MTREPSRWAVLAAAALVAACSPPWTELRRSSPPALAGESVIGVRFDLGATRVHRVLEREWLAELAARRTAAFVRSAR